MLFFEYMSAALLCLIWHKVCARFIRELPLFIFYLGALALVFCSFIPFSALFQAQYGIAQLSGLMFVFAGLYLLLIYDEDEKVRLAFLGFGCLCFALAVGCRPNMVLWSALVLPFIFKGIRGDRDIKALAKRLAVAAVPYAVVAAPLMLYNYLRFGSISEFGVRYMLTSTNHTMFTEYMFPTKVMYICATALRGYLLTPPALHPVFPFITPTVIPESGSAVFKSAETGVIGLFAIPISLYLIGIVRGRVYDRVKETSVAAALALPLGLAAALVMIVSSPFLGGIAVMLRYTADFYWFAVLTATVTAIMLKERVGIPERLYWRFSAAVMVVSALIGFFCVFSISDFAYGYNLASWYYFARVFNIFGGV
jgi:hypothetical protein